MAKLENMLNQSMIWSRRRFVGPRVADDVIIIQGRLRLGAAKEID